MQGLKKYDRTIDEDDAELADLEKYPEYSDQRNAIILVRGEKEVRIDARVGWFELHERGREGGGGGGVGVQEGCVNACSLWGDSNAYLCHVGTPDCANRYSNTS
jgi:hypothetical protein